MEVDENADTVECEDAANYSVAITHSSFYI